MKYSASVLLLLFACTALTAPAQSTNSISGKVVDPSNLPVPNATVYLHTRDTQIRRSTVANNEGAFSFKGLAQADYLLEAEAGGFSRSIESTVKPGVNDIRIELPLETVSTRVVVTASGTAQSTDEVAKAVDVIDSAEMSRRSQYSLMQALRLTPGMRIQQLGGPGSLTRVVTRGLRAFDTSVLIDGFRFRDVSAPQGDATGFLGDLLVVNTDRVEVLRGSGSSIYGTHATGGAINIVTDQGGGKLRGDILAEGGGLGVLRGVARFSGGALNDRFMFSGGFAHLNVMSGVDGDDRNRNSSAQGFAQYRLAPNTTLGGRVFFNDTFIGLNDSPYAASSIPATGYVSAIAGQTYIAAPNDPDSRRVSNFFTGMVKLDHRFNSRVSLRIGYNGLSTSRDNRDGPAGTRFEPAFSNSSLYDGRTDTIQARTDIQAGTRHLISLGYEFERERYDNLSTDFNPNVAARVNARTTTAQRSNSLFAQEQLRLLRDRLQISLSGRWQNFELDAPTFGGGAPRYTGITFAAPPRALTGDAALSYFVPSTGTKFRAHVGNAYRAPALYERFGTSFFFGSFSPLGDPRLRPERSLGLDAGFDQYLFNNKLRLSTSYFYTRLQEVIGYDSTGAVTPATDPFGRFGGYRNTGGGLGRGLEFTAEATPVRKLRIVSSYTYTKSMERISAVIGGSLLSPRVFEHQFSLLASRSFGKRTDLTYEMMAASNYMLPIFASTGSRPFIFPGPKRADISAGYNLPLSDSKTLRFYTRIENVFDRTFYEDGFKTPGIWAVGGLKLLF